MSIDQKLDQPFLYCFLLRMILSFIFLFLKQLLRNKLVSTARNSMKKNANLSQLYRSMQEAYNEMQTPLVYQTQRALVISDLGLTYKHHVWLSLKVKNVNLKDS